MSEESKRIIEIDLSEIGAVRQIQEKIYLTRPKTVSQMLQQKYKRTAVLLPAKVDYTIQEYRQNKKI